MPLLLVTGGGGFIGSHVVRAAMERGWRVRVVDSFRPDVHPRDAGDAALASSRGDDLLEVIEEDITRPGVAESVLEGVDAVSHQAAKVGLGVDFDDAPDYVHTNLVGTTMLLSAMARRHIDRLVLASSMVVYGEGLYTDGIRTLQPPPRAAELLDRRLFDPVATDGRTLSPVLVGEEDGLDPRNVYADTKLAQEHLTRSWARATGGRVAALRYHNVFGSGMPADTPYAGVASLFRSALERGEAPRVFEDGAQRRDFIDVRDVSAANIAAIEWTAGASRGTSRAFNIGSGSVHTVGEFATALARALDGPMPVVTGQYRLGDVRHITASSARARAELDWMPAHPFEAAIAEFARSPQRAPAAHTNTGRQASRSS